MTTKTKSKPRRRTAASRGPAVPDIIRNERTWMDANASQAAPIAGIAADDIHNIVPAMYQVWGAYGYQPALTWYQLANMYVSWEYTATEKIARTLASLPAKLYRYENAAGKTLKPYFVKSLTFAERLKQSTPERIAYKLRKDHGIKRVEIDEHPFLDLVNRPNPDMVRFNFWRLLAIHLELNGAVGIYKARQNGFGNPTELYILPTTWTGQFKPVPATDGIRLIKEYRLLDQNINEPFTLDEIIWIHYTSLRNPFEGMSALKAQLYSFNMDTYLMQQINAFYKNGAMFSNVFSTEARMTQKEYNEIAAQLTNYQGAKNAGQKFILHSGLKMEKPLNATARESMVDAIEKMARDKMLSSHDLSAGKIGLVESQNRSNLETVDMGFFNEAVKPRAMLITEYFDQYLVKNYDDNLDFEFDYPHFQDRAQDISERQSNIVNGLTTRNEERDKMGLEPIDGGDIILVSPMNVPLSSVVNPPEPPPAPAIGSGNGGAPDGGTAPTDDNGDGKPIVNDTKGGPGSGRYPKGSGKNIEGTGANIDISAVAKFINENEENGYIENPFPPVKENIARELSDLELLQYDTTPGLEEKFKDIKPELVNLKNLRNPSESEIETDNLIHLAKVMADNDLDLRNDPIHVIAYKGSKVLIDGNHRATACLLGGLTTIYAQVLNVNDKGQIYKAFKGGPGSGRYPKGSGEDKPTADKPQRERGVDPAEYERRFGVKPAESDADLERFLADVKNTPAYQDVLQRLAKYADETKTGPLTMWSQEQNKVNGEYTKERQELHEKIKNGILTDETKAAPGVAPQAILMLGAPASGKSEAGLPIAKELVGKDIKYATMDADGVKKELGAENWNVVAYHEESSDVIENKEDGIIRRGVDGGHNLIFDMTGANGGKMVGYAKELKMKGYDVHVVGVKVNDFESANRAWARYSKGGRFVDPNYASKTVDGKPDMTYDLLKNNSDITSAALVDNSGKESVVRIDKGRGKS